MQVLNEVFGDHIWFVGLQGSYGRDEATESSDIDIVVIFDEMSVSDIRKYASVLDILPHRELICGFVSGKNEIMNWEPSDLFQFYYDTRPIKGSLEELLPLIDTEAVDRAIKTGACNIYHGCVHNMLHEKSDEILKGLYKSATFVIQAICFRQTGNYISHLKDLVQNISAEERNIIETFVYLKNRGTIDFNLMSNALLDWSQKLINKQT